MFHVCHLCQVLTVSLWKKILLLQGKLTGLCGNFDKYTSNDLTTSNNMEVRNAQVFGDSWVLGQVSPMSNKNLEKKNFSF